MASPYPFPFHPILSATPSPDRSAFSRGPSVSPSGLQTFAQEVYALMGSKLQEQARSPRANPPAPSAPPSSSLPRPPSHPLNDPKYLAMASHIASYYQQRSQAIANYQHQRCVEWANIQQQKSREMTQVTMLVVAWYVRDRISRRRKRQKKRFDRGLSKRATGSKINKKESIKRWATNVPPTVESPTSPLGENVADDAEVDFDIDKEAPLDKDSDLFKAADQLIKSQLARIDVPLFGALSFDESENENEDEDGEAYLKDYEPMAEDEEDEEFDKDDEDFGDYEYDEDYEDELVGDGDAVSRDGDQDGGCGHDRGREGSQPGEEEVNSEEVNVGSGKASRKCRGTAA